MQTSEEVGKYVTDGKKVYPYNMYLDDLLNNGTLQFCEKPTNVKTSAKPVFRSPIKYTAEERLALAQKLGVTLGELNNMSPQEFETAMTQIESGVVATPAPAVAPAENGFPA